MTTPDTAWDTFKAFFFETILEEDATGATSTFDRYYKSNTTLTRQIDEINEKLQKYDAKRNECLELEKKIADAREAIKTFRHSWE